MNGFDEILDLMEKFNAIQLASILEEFGAGLPALERGKLCEALQRAIDRLRAVRESAG